MKDFSSGSNSLSRMRNKLKMKPNLPNALVTKESENSLNQEDNVLSQSLVSTK